MGYANPQIILNKSGDVINNEIEKFRGNLREEFDVINQRQQANIKENMKILEQQKQKRAMGDQVWYQNVESNRPKGGYADDTKAFLHNMHNRYWDLMNCDTPDCQAELRRIREVPRQLAEQRGAWDALNQDWQAGSKIDGVNPGGIDATNDPALSALMQYGNNVKKQYNFKTGEVDYLLFDENNEPVLDDKGNQRLVNGSSMVKGALDGSISVQTYGDPGSLRQEWQSGLAEKADYKSMVQTIDDQSDRYNQQKSKDYSVANNHLRSFVENGKLDKIMADSNEMRRSYPVVLKGLMSQASGDNPDQASIDALNGLGLLGADKKVGGGDDIDITELYATQAKAGIWQGNSEQKQAVEAYFKYLDPEDGLIKPDQIVTSRKLTDDSYTTAQRAAIEKAKLKNQGSSNKQSGNVGNSGMTKNQIYTKINELAKIERDGGTLSKGQRKELEDLNNLVGASDIPVTDAKPIRVEAVEGGVDKVLGKDRSKWKKGTVIVYKDPKTGEDVTKTWDGDIFI